MGQRRRVYLSGATIWACKQCKAHLTTSEMLISTKFQGSHGKAILLDAVVNVDKGPAYSRRMTSGMHVVRDLVCAHCGTVIGWFYEQASDSGQKYKEGRYILEWTLLVDRSKGQGRGGDGTNKHQDQEEEDEGETDDDEEEEEDDEG